MIARVLLLPAPARRTLAAAAVAAGVVLTAAIIALLALSLTERASARAELAADTDRLYAALQARLDAQGPAGPVPAPDAATAEQGLIEAAARIADLSPAGVSAGFGAPQPARIGAVDEMRLEVTLSGPPDALARTLSALSAVDARVFVLSLQAEEAALTTLRLTLVTTIEEGAR